MITAASLAVVGAAAWMPQPAGLWVAIAALLVNGLMFALMGPFRAALLNDLIPSRQRATILSFDSLAASAGGAGIQPALGKAADVWGLGVAYLLSAGLVVLAAPFVMAVRALGLGADIAAESAEGPAGVTGPESPRPDSKT